jgi:anti-sigma regulatory factor (Ser/Thr protein kinase)
MAERKIGGLGIHLVKTLTDSASYAREGGRNVLILERKVS